MKKILNIAILIVVTILSALAAPFKWYFKKACEPGTLYKGRHVAAMAVYFLDELIHIVPIVDASSNPATGVLGAFVDMLQYESVEFVIHVGTLGTADYTFKLQASAATNGGTATDLPFYYRKSAAAGTDSMGTPTAVAAASTINMAFASDSDKLLLLDVNASDVVATVDAKPFVGVYATRGSSASATISVDAILKPRYPQKTQINAFA